MRSSTPGLRIPAIRNCIGSSFPTPWFACAIARAKRMTKPVLHKNGGRSALEPADPRFEPLRTLESELKSADMRVSDETAKVHPRPQLSRAHWMDLCGPWAFRFDDENKGLRERWFERADVFGTAIMVPYPPAR